MLIPTTPPYPGGRQPHYVVCLPAGLMALDLVGAIEEVVPTGLVQGRIHVLADLAGLQAFIAGWDRGSWLDVAFVWLGAQSPPGDDVEDLLAQLACFARRVVLMGSAAEEGYQPRAPHAVLHRPFGSADVHRLLAVSAGHTAVSKTTNLRCTR